MNLVEIGQRMRWLAEENCSSVKVCYGELDYEKLFNVIYDIPIGSQFSSGADEARLKSIICAAKEADSLEAVDAALLELNLGKKTCTWRQYCEMARMKQEENVDPEAEAILIYLEDNSPDVAVERLRHLLVAIYEKDRQLVLERK